MENIKKLRTEFTNTSWGYVYKQRYINRENGVVIYQVNESLYEIFRYKVSKPDKFHETEYERYPSNESFGVWAWTVPNKDGIRKILIEKFDLDDDSISEIVNTI